MLRALELKLLGITYNQVESGVYALILEEPMSKRRLPIVIGFPEAQSIECKLQEVKTPRPLTHDVMATMLKTLNATLDNIFIHQLPTGVFAATLNLTNEIGEKLHIDSRSSDAIALAIRVGAPILIGEDLLQRAGFEPDSKPVSKMQSRPTPKPRVSIEVKPASKTKNDYSKMSVKDLHHLLVKLVGEEQYEEAAKVKEEIERREKEGN